MEEETKDFISEYKSLLKETVSTILSDDNAAQQQIVSLFNLIDK